jgi:hypothetical protein
MNLHLAHPAEAVLGTRTLLDVARYNETGNPHAAFPMNETKKRGKGNAR